MLRTLKIQSKLKERKRGGVIDINAIKGPFIFSSSPSLSVLYCKERGSGGEFLSGSQFNDLEKFSKNLLTLVLPD